MNTGGNEQLDQLIHLIYAAADDPANWPQFLSSYLELADQTAITDELSLNLPVPGLNDTETLAATLFPHFERSFNLGLRLQGIKDQQSHLRATLDQMPMAILLVDRSLLIRHRNLFAQELLDQDTIIGERNGALQLFQSDNQRQIRIAVETAITEQRAINLSLLTKDESDNVLTLLVSPVGEANDVTAREAGIFIAQRKSMNIQAESIKSLFGLTSAEAELALQLINGTSMSEYAKIKGVSNNTLRTQLRSIFDKTGTNRQPDLVSLLLTSTASLRPPAPPANMQLPCNGHKRSAQEIQLRDGRTLGYAEYGSAHGWPIIFCHGLRGSRLERPPQHVFESLSRIRLIIIDRPGYGLSSPLLNRGYSDWPNDVEQLLDALGIERCSVLGFSIGGAYAMALSSCLPERILKLGLAGTVAPLSAPIESNSIRPGHKIIANLARFSPTILTDVIELISTDIYRNPERHIDRFMLRSCAPDIALLQKPELRKLYLQALDEGGRYGRRHIAEEMVRLSRDWGFSLGDISCPTFIWHGDEDPTVPIGQVRSLAKCIPDATFTTLPEQGHFFLYGSWHKILSAVMDESDRSKKISSLVSAVSADKAEPDRLAD